MGHVEAGNAHEFPEGLTWLNSISPVSLRDLKGNVVILDFWTYCCINCIHMIPILSHFEKEFENDPVVFIGIHSAKFTNEEIPSNVTEAILRYDVRHPVVIDKDMKIWKSYGVSAWPTFIIIDPNGRIAAKIAGEQDAEYLRGIISRLLAEARQTKSLSNKVHIKSEIHRKERTLSYPGKIALSSKEIAVSDSNHNRILIVNKLTGAAMSVGGKEGGFLDGDFKSARFSKPQGVYWSGNKIYVADTGNHAIREIDLDLSKVITLAGTGRQGKTFEKFYSGEGRFTELNSPWDLAVSNNYLYIAMAGTHQIWRYDLVNGKIGPFSGDGHENIKDGDLREAEFAQPSGIAFSNNHLYIADSESSSIRSIYLNERYVSTLIGKGLFSFGNEDGKLSEAKLQHPIGISSSGTILYVADTYNHSVKKIDLEKKEIHTLIGLPSSKSSCKFDDPSCDSLGLFEPNDVKPDEGKLYIADTNNHLIRVFDTQKGILNTLNVIVE